MQESKQSMLTPKFDYNSKNQNEKDLIKSEFDDHFFTENEQFVQVSSTHNYQSNPKEKETLEPVNFTQKDLEKEIYLSDIKKRSNLNLDESGNSQKAKPNYQSLRDRSSYQEGPQYSSPLEVIPENDNKPLKLSYSPVEEIKESKKSNIPKSQIYSQSERQVPYQSSNLQSQNQQSSNFNKRNSTYLAPLVETNNSRRAKGQVQSEQNILKPRLSQAEKNDRVDKMRSRISILDQKEKANEYIGQADQGNTSSFSTREMKLASFREKIGFIEDSERINDIIESRPESRISVRGNKNKRFYAFKNHLKASVNLEKVHEDIKNQIERHSKIEGYIGKKKLKPGRFSSSGHQRYFAFLEEGRIFAYWEQEPKSYEDTPKFACLTRYVMIVKDNYENKKDHLYIVNENTKDIHQKFNKEIDQKRWADALKFFSGLYNPLNKEKYGVAGISTLKKAYSDRKEWEMQNGNAVNPYIMLMIMCEREKIFWQIIEKKIDVTDILDQKHLLKHFQIIPKDISKRRIMSGQAKVGISKQVKGGVDSPVYKNRKTLYEDSHYEANTQVLPYTMNQLVNPKDAEFTDNKRLVILVTSKAWGSDNFNDDNILTDENLPTFVLLDWIYIINAEYGGQLFDHKIFTKDILSIEPLDDKYIKNGYTFQIETKEQVYFLTCDRATECLQWLEIIRKSKRTIEEKIRSKFGGCLDKNIDPLINLYKGHPNYDFDQSIRHDSELYLQDVNIQATSPAVFLATYVQTLAEFDGTMDALQCHRPFYNDFFKNYLKLYHLRILDIMVRFWNTRMKEFVDEEVLKLMEIIHKQDEICKYYGMTEPRFPNALRCMGSTYATRVFFTTMPKITEIIDSIKKDYYQDKGMYQTTAPKKLFNMMNEIFEGYYSSTQEVVVRNILSVCYKLVKLFQISYKKLIDGEDDFKDNDSQSNQSESNRSILNPNPYNNDNQGNCRKSLIEMQEDKLQEQKSYHEEEYYGYSIEIWCAFINSNLRFIEEARDFQSFVRKETLLDIETINLMVSYNDMIKTFVELSNSAFVKVKNKIMARIDQVLDTNQVYTKFKIEPVLELFSKAIDQVSNGLYPHYAKKMWKSIFDDFCEKYLKFLVKILPEHEDPRKDYISQMRKEMFLIIQTFKKDKHIQEKDWMKKQAALEAFVHIFEMKDPQLTPMLKYMNLVIGLLQEPEEVFNINFVKLVVQHRTDLGERGEDALFDWLERQDQTYKKTKKDKTNKLIKKSIWTEHIVWKWCQRFRNKVAEKKHKNAKVKKQILEDNMFVLKKEDKLEIEETCKGLSERLEVYIKKLPEDCKENHEKYFKRKINDKLREKMKTYWFFLSDEIMGWKQDWNAKGLDGRIYYYSMKDLKIHEVDDLQMYYLYFRVADVMYVLFFKTEKECRLWIRSIVFMRVESRKKLERIEFEKFNAVAGELAFEDIFVQDQSVMVNSAWIQKKYVKPKHSVFRKL